VWRSNFTVVSSVCAVNQLFFSVFRTCDTLTTLCILYLWHTNFITMSSVRVAHQLYLSSTHVAHKYYLSFFCACGTPIILYCLPYVWHTNFSVMFSAMGYTNYILVSDVKQVLIKIRVFSYVTLFDFTDSI
jgi:hypothetical protein